MFIVMVEGSADELLRVEVNKVQSSMTDGNAFSHFGHWQPQSLRPRHNVGHMQQRIGQLANRTGMITLLATLEMVWSLQQQLTHATTFSVDSQQLNGQPKKRT